MDSAQDILQQVGAEMLRRFFGELVRYTILVFTVFAVLSQFGVQTASILAVLGAGALAIGLAVQGTLANVAAGVMLQLFRPFRVGDYVEVAGHGGTVKGLNLFVTELATPDNVQLLVPNGNVWGQAVKNYSRNPTRRLKERLDEAGLNIPFPRRDVHLIPEGARPPGMAAVAE